jgi:tetratricopeptide (TPR) repeat protein
MMRAGWIGLVAALWGGTGLAGPPVLKGTYQVNELGLLDFKTQGDTVTATWMVGGRCVFSPADTIIEGTFEGSVLVGVLKTCAEPPSCGQLVSIPFLGTFSGGVMTAFVEPPRGCTTPGVQGPLTFTPTNDTRFVTGAAYLQREPPDLELAIAILRPAAAKPDGTLDALGDFGVLYALGAALSQKGEFTEARSVLLRALKTGAPPATQRADVLFNLACVEANLISKVPTAEGEAIEHLREALRLGKPGQFRSDFLKDDLAPLRGNPEFRKLSDLAKKGLK